LLHTLAKTHPMPDPVVMTSPHRGGQRG
jgi:hypothetical protein